MSRLQILQTTRPAVDSASHVIVDRPRLQQLCREWVQHPLPIPGWDAEIHWSDGGPATLNYILLLDALNFCFWSNPGVVRWEVQHNGRSYDGYKALSVALRRAVEEGIPVTSSEYLAKLTREQLASILRGNVEAPMLDQRLLNAREVGQVLQEHFNGQFSQAIEQVKGSAVDLVELLVKNFSSFQDVAVYKGRDVRLLKRAQITVVDIFGTFEGKGWGEFADIGELTAFADYKIPQVLRAQGILIYSEELAERVDKKMLIAAGSEEEIEIRAAMIWAVEWIREELHKLGRELKAYELDWLLWNIGQEPVPNERPYHRTLTYFY